jgi:hypothetical protein
MTHIKSGRRWDNGHWWFKLTHVCPRWRDLILGSAPYLPMPQPCLHKWHARGRRAGTFTTPSTRHRLSLPRWRPQEEEIILALEQRERVRYIRLSITVLNLQKLIMYIDKEYPTLEYLVLAPPNEDDTGLVLSKTLQTPHLRHLALFEVALPTGSRLHITAVGLVTLCLTMTHPTYIQPAVLLQWLSFLPRLENLIYLSFPDLFRDVERQPIQTPIATHITLPNLRSFAVKGVGLYLGALFRRITTPRLEKLQIGFFKQVTFSVAWLLQFMNATENFVFDRAEFGFYDGRVYVEVYPLEAMTAAFSINVLCLDFDWQVSSVAQIFNELSQMFCGGASQS